MERSRSRTLLGIGLIVLGVIFLSQALALEVAPLPVVASPTPGAPRSCSSMVALSFSRSAAK